MNESPSAPAPEQHRAGLSRRQWLGSVAVTGAVAMFAKSSMSNAFGQSSGSGLKASVAAEAVTGSGPTPSIDVFGLDAVTLGDGIMSNKRKLMLDYLTDMDANRLLVNFRTTAGLDPGPYAPLIGWEQPTQTLRGHYTGHYMSALAQAYASTGDAGLKTKMSTLVDGIRECRDELDSWVDAGTAPTAVSVTGPFSGAKGISVAGAQYVNLPSSAGLGSGTDFTLSIWANPTQTLDWARLYEAGNDSNKYMFLSAANASGYPSFAIKSGSGAAEQGVAGKAALPLNTWSNIVVTLTGGTLKLYVNGTLVNSTTGVTATPAVVGALTDHWIGRSHFAADPYYYGSVSELNIWDSALTQAQVTALQAGPAAGTSVGIGNIASFAFSDDGTNTIANQTPSGANGTLVRTWVPSHKGFVSAYPETQFILLESITGGDYPTVWAPYYTIHKIMAGLVAIYHVTPDQTTKDNALSVLSGLCDWMYSRLSVLPASTLQRMWSIFSSGEYGGVQEAIMDTYDLTQVENHKTLATLFDDHTLIGNCATNTDTLTNIHANQHIPFFIGIVRQHEAGITPAWLNGKTYLDAAKNFWPMVIDHRIYSIGGTGYGEFWKAPDVIAGYMDTTGGPESCCTYNMLKLSRILFRHDPDPKYMEYYEKGLYNHILGSKEDAPHDGDRPLVTYPNPQGPGSVRSFYPQTGATCCEGTGMENATKYQDTVFMATTDNSALYVNLFAPATLTWAAKNVTIAQTTTFPVQQGTTLTISGSATFALRIRRPGWAKTGYGVKVNGTVVDTSAVDPGTYLEISRAWKDGDSITIDMPFTFRTEATPDDPTLRSVFYGPILMVALAGSSTTAQTVSFNGKTRLSGDLVDSFTPVSGKTMHFTASGLEWAPFYEGNTLNFDSYAHHQTPVVAFAGVSSGVANRVGPDGTTTLLDHVWNNAPFGNKQAFLNQVEKSTATWSAAGKLSTVERQRVLVTAGKAPVKA